MPMTELAREAAPPVTWEEKKSRRFAEGLPLRIWQTYDTMGSPQAYLILRTARVDLVHEKLLSNEWANSLTGVSHPGYSAGRTIPCFRHAKSETST